jgi:plastocyanin
VSILGIIIFAIGIFAVSIAASTIVLAYAQQQDVITIIPGANDKNNPVFFDVTYYPIQVGKELHWYNADDVNHKIIISSDNGVKGAGGAPGTAREENKTVFASGDIKPKASFSYRFDKEGMYHFLSPLYPWMRGTVLVSNDISTTAMTSNLNNSVAIQLAWSPSKPNAGGEEQTHFIITFINEKSNKNQEHIDYRFIIYDGNNKRVFEQGLHSGWGVEQAAYRFMTPGNYKAEVTINYILFVPVQPDVARFNIVATK